MKKLAVYGVLLVSVLMSAPAWSEDTDTIRQDVIRRETQKYQNQASKAEREKAVENMLRGFTAGENLTEAQFQAELKKMNACVEDEMGNLGGVSLISRAVASCVGQRSVPGDVQRDVEKSIRIHP